MDGDGFLSREEIIQAEVISLNNVKHRHAFKIKDLTGIEYFTALSQLDCAAAGITAMDVRKNLALKSLKFGITDVKRP